MKRTLGILCCIATTLISQEPQMIIHRTSGTALTLALSEIDSVTFDDTVSVQTLVSELYDPYMQFKAAQYVYEAENGRFSTTLDELGLTELFKDSYYFTFATVGAGGVEATAKKSDQGIAAGSKIGMKLTPFSDSVTYYGTGSFDSAAVDSLFRNMQ